MLRAFVVLVTVALLAVVAVNLWVQPIPGLEWARPAAAPTDGNPTAAGTGAASGTETADTSKSGRRGGSGGGRSGGGSGRPGDFGPAPVTVAEARTADVPVYLRGVGTARPLASVTIRPQVDGRLIKVHFKEGQEVQRGDLLAEIDPTTYRAQLDQAIAKRRLTEVQLANAKLDLDRLTSVAVGVVTAKAVDTQRAQVAQFEAQIKADAAAIANLQAVLDYTRITAPFAGRTGQRLVDEGTLLRAGADAGIVTISQIRPVAVQFTLPQQQLGAVKAAMDRAPLAVDALGADDTTVVDRGTLTFFDNQVDAGTGTVRMKADMPNDRYQLWPGQFVNVRLEVDTLRGVMTVPTAAVQRGPTGPFVFVLIPPAGGSAGREGTADPKATVVLRPVTVTLQDERVAAIASGVVAGESVVTSGFARLRDGAEVTLATAADRGRAPSDGAASPSQRPAGPKPAPADASPPVPSAASPPAPSAGPPTAEGGPGSTGTEPRRRADGERGAGRSGAAAAPSVVQ